MVFYPRTLREKIPLNSDELSRVVQVAQNAIELSSNEAIWLVEHLSSIRLEVEDGIKKCPKCGRLLPLDGFYISASRKDGHQSRCKGCSKEAAKLRNIAYPDKAAESYKKWKEKNPEKAKECARNSAKKHREKVRKLKEADPTTRWRILHPEEFRAQRQKARDELSSSYVKNVIARRSTLNISEVPDEMVEMKRTLLQLKRLAAEQKTGGKK